jgi:hypothetical protein
MTYSFQIEFHPWTRLYFNRQVWKQSLSPCIRINFGWFDIRFMRMATYGR